MNTYVTSAGFWLKSKFINAPNDWLEACIDWINSENEGNIQSQKQVNELVFEQWLLSDLHELGTQCLPQQLKDASKYQLNGTYALQIDSMVDISQSCYSQLQKVKGTENANAEVSADDTHKPWEPKPSRMLMLKLTDGTTDIQGMEYRQITCLDSKIHPGCKILIKGSILCRHGMLMLKGDNLTILGGEVDSLVESNTQENILKMTLEANVANADKRYRKEFEGGPVTSTGDVKPVVKSSQNLSRNSFSGKRSFEGITPQVKSEQLSQNDEFDEDLPMDAFLDDMVEFNDNQLNTSNINNNSLNRSGSNRTNVTRNPNTSNFSKLPTLNQSSSRSSDISSRNISNHNRLSKQTYYSNDVQSASPEQNPTVSVQYNNTRTSVKQEDMSDFMNDDFEDDFDMPVTSHNKTNSDNASSNSNNSKKRHLLSPEENHNSVSSKRRSFLASPDFDNEIDEFQQSASNNQFHEITKKKPLFSSPTGNIKLEQSNSVPVYSNNFPLNSNLGFDFDKAEPSSQGVDLNYDPWTYLSVVKKYLPTQQLICFKVKAYISTLMGKLECPDGKRWCLPVKINDGTASMDVDLSNKVLTDLIGFSAAESQVLRKMAKTDVRVREKLAEGIKKCQQKLVELLCIMEIEISPQVAKPEVTSLLQITTADISVLADRLSKTVHKLS